MTSNPSPEAPETLGPPGHDLQGDDVGGRCMLHPDQPAVGRCGLCGAFRCAECTEEGTDRCPTCRERTGWVALPFDRTNWTLSGVFNLAMDAFRRHVRRFVSWGVLMVLFSFVIPFGTQFAGGLAGAFLREDSLLAIALVMLLGFSSQLLGLFVQFGMLLVALDTLQGRSRSWGQTFGYALRRMFVALAAWFLLSLPGVLFAALLVAVAVVFRISPLQAENGFVFFLLVFGGMLFLFPLALWLMVRFAFLNQEVLFDPSCGPVEALRRSWRLTEGQWFKALLVLLFSGVVSSAGMVACIVGIAFSAPLGALMQVVAFLALRRGSGLPEPRG